VEYGVESTLDRTLERVNRCHTWEDSQIAISKTIERGIATGAHLILGLPGESKDEILEHASRISALALTTIKLHQLQIIRGTAMARDYLRNPSSFSLLSLEDYIDLCVSFAERLNPELYIERFASQSPKELLIAPDWGLKNYELTDRIIKRFDQRDTCQGKLYGK
jgi:radical SAM protein (TIGR01212 family)